MKAIVIGGGAAGLFAAGFLAKGGVETTVIEHSTDTARKCLSQAKAVAMLPTTVTKKLS